MTSTEKTDMHFNILTELNETYKKKNHDYGDSFHETWLEEGAAMARIRLSDKLSRFKKLSKAAEKGEGQRVMDESIEDTLLDLANYAVMTVMEMRLDRAKKEFDQPEIKPDCVLVDDKTAERTMKETMKETMRRSIPGFGLH